MSGRAANPLDLTRVSALLRAGLTRPERFLATALPAQLAADALGSWLDWLPRMVGLRGRLRVFLEEEADQVRSVALVYDGRRAEWVVLVLAALAEPGGADSAFRLLSDLSAAAARAGLHRLFAAVPPSAHAQEPFFQAGFYSYTRESWFVSSRTPLARPSRKVPSHAARSADAHDLFRFYSATTPHAVQRAEQLSFSDFDVSRRGGAYEPPHLIGGNPLAMRRSAALVVGDGAGAGGFALSFEGTGRHPHVLKVRTAGVDVDLARDLVRMAAAPLPAGRPIVAPVRSYEEHVGRALFAEGFREAGTAMLFVKELAVRIEEPALAPAVVR